VRALYQAFSFLLCAFVAPFLYADDLDAPSWRRYALEPGSKPSAPTPVRPSSLKLRGDAPESRERIVARAHELLGHRYSWGGASLETGFDCSGLLVYLYRSVANRKLPRTTQSMLAQRNAAITRSQLKPGDAVFFSHNGSARASHVGLYIGDNRFIHAPSSGKTIRINSLDEPYWQRTYVTARNFSG
jgi:cell wall-associated NlpC family hydrolase